jgi:hypothetical protein
MQGHIRRQIQQQTLLSLQSQQYQQGMLCVSANHGLINYIDTKAKCRRLKNVPTESNKQLSKQIRKMRYLLASWKSLAKRAGSGSGSVNQVYESKDADADPDPDP